jgi:hypothetical protein
MIEDAIAPRLDEGGCPHMAILLKREDDLVQVLADFYALGVRRDGWCVHRSLPGHAADDREALTACGLPVAELEGSGRLAIAEFNLTLAPEEYPKPWEAGLEDALARGRSGLWYSRVAVGPDTKGFDEVLTYDRAWDRAFHGRPVITLCPFVVGALDGAATLDRFAALARMHDQILVPDRDGFHVAETAPSLRETFTPG